MLKTPPGPYEDLLPQGFTKNEDEQSGNVCNHSLCHVENGELVDDSRKEQG